MNPPRYTSKQLGALLDSLDILYRAGGRRKLEEEKLCRLCEEREAYDRHHIVPKHWFVKAHRFFFHTASLVKSCDANMIPMCRECHDLVEDYVDARAELRKKMKPDEIVFALTFGGEKWFDFEYPS